MLFMVHSMLDTRKEVLWLRPKKDGVLIKCNHLKRMSDCFILIPDVAFSKGWGELHYMGFLFLCGVWGTPAARGKQT